MHRALTGLFLLASVAAPQDLKFDAASVKPHSPGPSPSAMPNDPVSFTAPGMTFRLLTAAAYDVPDSQVSGGPPWADTERFDIQAKAAGPSTAEQKHQMLRTLLADRFQLKVHREPGTVRAYALTVAKEGLKIHPANPQDPPPAPKPGAMALHVSMKQFASILDNYVRFLGGQFPGPGAPPLSKPEALPVIDQTGLEGDYDVRLDLTRSSDCFTVLPEQLGVQLVARKIPVDLVVIDSAARPSSN